MLLEDVIDKELMLDQIFNMLAVLGMQRGEKAVQAVLSRYDVMADFDDPDHVADQLLMLSPMHLSQLMYRLRGMIHQQSRIEDKLYAKDVRSYAH